MMLLLLLLLRVLLMQLRCGRCVRVRERERV